MSWLLTLDRGKRDTRKAVNYNDKKMWSSILKEPDDDDVPKKPDQKKRKRGRPPRSQTPDQQITLPPEQKKKRGRPPKVRPVTPQKEFPLPGDVSPQRKPVRTISEPVRTLKSSAMTVEDYIDYVYEYEYEYPEEEEKQEKNEETVKEMIIPQETKETDEKLESESPKTSPVRPKGRPPLKVKKAQSGDECDFIQEEMEMFSLEEIIGVRDIFDVKEEMPHYLVKFENRAYVHCRWVSKEELLKFDGGSALLREFNTTCEKLPLDYSLSFPGLKVCDEGDLNTIWYEVERVLREANGFSGGMGYLCKWKGLEYDKATLEQGNVISDPQCITSFKLRQKRRNPVKIPSRWVHPKAELYEPITEKPISKRGEIMKDFQLEGLNWLRKCWFEQKNSVISDDTRIGKFPQAVMMLSWLSKTYNVHGPFLVLASNLDRWQQAFDDWSDLNAVVFAGSGKSRQLIFENECEVRDEHGRTESEFVPFDVLITTYDVFLTCYQQNFERIEWRYVIADDGSKMCNFRGRVRKLLKTCKYEHATLLMEWEIKNITAAQKNTVKLYFLLNFLDPGAFNNLQGFLQEYTGADDAPLPSSLLEILESFMLNRDKDAIEEAMSPKKKTFLVCEPSLVQKKTYKDLVKQNTNIFMRKITDEADAPLISLITVLRKLCNHPFLVSQSLRDEIEQELGAESLVESSGKLMAIDKLLPVFLPAGNKVVIFSQMVRVLDVLGSYLTKKGTPFLRIDSSIPCGQRFEIQEQFRTGECQVLLLSSKPDAYHLPVDIGDVIIVYDNDSYIFLQETKASVYHLITKGSFEMQMWGPDSDRVCFDKTVIGSYEGHEPSWIDAQDIELMLRGSIHTMYSDDDETWKAFCALSGEELLEKCGTDRVIGEKPEINIKKQTDFWTHYLDPPQKRTSSIDSGAVELEFITKLAQGLNDRGFKGSDDELKLLKCALTLAPPSNKETLKVIQSIVGDNSSDEPMNSFAQSIFMVERLSNKFFDSVVFFSKLPKVLYCATLPDLKWPSVAPLWEDAGCEYALLYAVAENGYRNVTSVPEAKSLTRAQLEKRVRSLAKKILNQFPHVTVPPDFIPLEPEVWKSQHPEMIKRISLTPEEVLLLFNHMRNRGVPHTPDTHELDIASLTASLKMDGVAPEACEEVIDDIIDCALSVRSPDAELSFKQFPNAKPLRKNVTSDDLRELLLVCRLMEKVYEFSYDFNVDEEKLFSYVRLKDAPEWWTPGHSRSLILALLYRGVNIEDWKEDERIIFTSDQIASFLSTPESRVRLASEIVSQARGYASVADPSIEGGYILKSSANLKIESFGRVVANTALRARNYPYPIGFAAQRLMVRNVPQVPHVWYRCEIQAIGTKLLFVTSLLDTPNKDFVELSPIDSWLSLIRDIAGDTAVDAVRKLKLPRDWPLGFTPSVIEKLQEHGRLVGLQFSTDESQSDASDDDIDFKPDH